MVRTPVIVQSDPVEEAQVRKDRQEAEVQALSALLSKTFPYLSVEETIRGAGALLKEMGRNGGRKQKRESAMSKENRKAAGERLVNARIAKLAEEFGIELTVDQFRALRLRPGQKPTKGDLERVAGKAKAKKSKK